MTNSTKDGMEKYKETKRIIRKAMMERQLVLFVGAGASIASGMPTWHDAVEEIAAKLGIECNEHDGIVIPQYYYAARGGKEYTQLVHEIFQADVKLVSGDVHKKILDFNTETIITTNYDNLIELAAEKVGEFIFPVRQDRDLSYRRGGRELIKMHGDFVHDNFVLKEDDYLNYSNNFRLIENYVKSLIGTKTVLFIGYSFSDPDVKHIFSWVKNILDEDFQRAYMIVVGDVADGNRENYFSHLGVNTINATELFNHSADSQNDKTKQLLQVLNYLLDDSDERQVELIDAIYDYLMPFTSLNYTYWKYVDGLFDWLWRKLGRSVSSFINKERYIVVQNIKKVGDDEKKILEELKDVNDNKPCSPVIRGIYEALRKSNIRGIKYLSDNVNDFKYENWEFNRDEALTSWAEAIYTFDFNELNRLKNYNFKVLSDRNPELYLIQAYICAFLGDYLSSYSCLDNATRIFYGKNEYSWYFISLWNRKNISKLFYSRLISHDADAATLERIKADYEAIKLDKSLTSLPNLGNDCNLFLRDMKDFRFASDLFSDVVENTVKSNMQSAENYAFFSGMPAYGELREQVYDYYRYGLFNYLLMDRYNENNQIYELFVRGILASVGAPEKESVKTIFGMTGNVHAEYLDAMDIHLILRYIDTKKLDKLFQEFKITKIVISDDGWNYLRKVAENLDLDSELYGNYMVNVFWSLTCLVSHTDFDNGLACLILDSMTKQKKNDIRLGYGDTINKFIHAISRNNLDSDEKVGEKALNLMKWILEIASDSDYFSVPERLVNSIAYLCQGTRCYLDDEKYIESLLDERRCRFLATVYNACSEKLKKVISVYFFSWNCPDESEGYILYCNLVSLGILTSNPDIESKAFNFIQRNSRSDSFSISCADDVERGLVRLFLADLICDRERLHELVEAGNDECLKWIVDADGYDYSKFSIEWLKHSPEQVIAKVAVNSEKNKKILAVYREKAISGEIDECTHQIIAKYFIR